MNDRERVKLESLYPQWLEDSIQRISPISTLDGNLQDQLQDFYHLLVNEPMESMDEPVRRLLSNWNANILSEHQDALSEALLLKLINELYQATAELCKTEIREKDAFRYFEMLSPFLMRCIEIAHDIELEAVAKTSKTDHKGSDEVTLRMNTMQSEFFQLTSETLVTPVTLIEGYATMIESQIDMLPEKNSELEMLIKGMKNGISRLTNLVNEMSYLALIDQKRLDISKQPIIINQFLQKLDRDFQSTLAKRDLSLSFQINNTDQMINIDVEKMLYALNILIHYTISTTPDKGAIEIITDTIQDKLQVQIIDNGYGLSTQQKSELFNKLKKSDTSNQVVRKFSNISGNGLYIVKGIIQNHLGSLWVDSPIYESIDQAGKRFNILLPIK
ncbi:MAG: HAMP domain-containing histidine kinase [Anaerolineaceae bacterium]|nr:HAMP domain-containing histidine kinase [Anaerolineaceae bacterium]